MIPASRARTDPAATKERYLHANDAHPGSYVNRFLKDATDDDVGIVREAPDGRHLKPRPVASRES